MQIWVNLKAERLASANHYVNRNLCKRELISEHQFWPQRLNPHTWATATVHRYNYEDTLLQKNHQLLHRDYCKRDPTSEHNIQRETLLQARRKLWSNIIANDNQHVNEPVQPIVSICTIVESLMHLQLHTLLNSDYMIGDVPNSNSKKQDVKAHKTTRSYHTN